MSRITIHEDESIWRTDCQAIVVTVNCTGAMGAGIARQCRDRYPDIYARYKAQCKAGRWQPGMIALERIADKRYIILASTKDKWWDGSQIDWVKACIQKIALLQDGYNVGIKSVAMPPMGCGHGGLDKRDFIAYVQDQYKATPVNFHLYV